MKNLLLDKHKLHWHPDVMDKFLKGEVFPPINVEISPSSRCNQKCGHCYTRYITESEIAPALIEDDLYFKVIHDCVDFGVKAIIICGAGEPMLHPKTPEAISCAKMLGMDVCMATNGMLATKEKMKRCLKNLSYIRFSISAGTPKRYAELQGSTEKAFHQVMENLQDLVNLKRLYGFNTTIGVAYPLFEGCENEIIPFVKSVRRIGVDYIQLKPCGDFKKSGYVYKKETYRNEVMKEKLKEAEKLTTDNFYCQVKYDRFKWLEEAEEKGLPGKCWGLLIYTQVGSDGKVYTCSGSWYDENDCYGDLNKNTLKEIWHSDRLKEVFERRSKADKNLCFYQCRNIIMNEYLMKLKKPPMHINFV